MVEEGTISIDEETWQFLIENRVEELAEPVRKMLAKLLQKRSTTPGDDLAIERGKDYFLSIEQEAAKRELYKMLRTDGPKRRETARDGMDA